MTEPLLDIDDRASLKSDERPFQLHGFLHYKATSMHPARDMQMLEDVSITANYNVHLH